MAKLPTIFVSVAAYCEPHLHLTIHQLFAKATHPQRIHVGLVDQSEHLNPAWLSQFPARKNINYVGLSPVDSRGVSWARSIAFSLYNDQDYLLQIDSHTLFDPGWDELLIEQLLRLQAIHPKPLISTYPQVSGLMGRAGRSRMNLQNRMRYFSLNATLAVC